LILVIGIALNPLYGVIGNLLTDWIQDRPRRTWVIIIAALILNLLELEPDILLELARWHRLKQEPKEAYQQAKAALNIANRNEYRLKQADIHDFLAQLALDANDLETVHYHATIGLERAECDGAPYWYKPAVDYAKRLLEA